jgi:hypothetical protein
MDVYVGRLYGMTCYPCVSLTPTTNIGHGGAAVAVDMCGMWHDKECKYNQQPEYDLQLHKSTLCFLELTYCCAVAAAAAGTGTRGRLLSSLALCSCCPLLATSSVGWSSTLHRVSCGLGDWLFFGGGRRGAVAGALGRGWAGIEQGWIEQGLGRGWALVFRRGAVVGEWIRCWAGPGLCCWGPRVRGWAGAGQEASCLTARGPCRWGRGLCFSGRDNPTAVSFLATVHFPYGYRGGTLSGWPQIQQSSKLFCPCLFLLTFFLSN